MSCTGTSALPLHRTFRALVGEESFVQPCVDSYRARYREMAASETIVVPGIREILDALANQLPLLAATSKPRALAEPLLDALNLRGFFAALIGPELDSENEQKARTVGRAINELSPTPSEFYGESAQKGSCAPPEQTRWPAPRASSQPSSLPLAEAHQTLTLHQRR
jgi:phosphoglycolate phosphatase-like HAD superfamily hydrolase